MVEFAFGGWGTNPVMGTPRNPWDLVRARIPGGSSSGSGVAVAAGLAPAALGSDTGGSVRIPAALNGITGLKTTRGLISLYGAVAGSMIIGIVDTLAGFYIAPDLKEVVYFGIFLLILVLRPNGLFGVGTE